MCTQRRATDDPSDRPTFRSRLLGPRAVAAGSPPPFETATRLGFIGRAELPAKTKGYRGSAAARRGNAFVVGRPPPPKMQRCMSAALSARALPAAQHFESRRRRVCRKEIVRGFPVAQRFESGATSMPAAQKLGAGVDRQEARKTSCAQGSDFDQNPSFWLRA